jgi:hypothetical protein
MSLSFNTIHTRDERLNVKGGDYDFAVETGGSSVTAQVFAAISQSTSQHTYSVTPPSISTGVSRRVLLKTTVTFQVSGIPKNGQYLVDFSQGNSALQAFALQQGLIQTANVQINNTSVTQNNDVIPFILRMMSKEDTLALNATSPCMLDNYADYVDGINANNNVLAGYNTSSYDRDFVGRGAYQVTVVSGNAVGDGVNSRSAVLSCTLVEPLLINPFCWSSKTQSSALFGINQINVTLNLNTSPVNFWKSSGDQLQSGGLTVQVTGYTNSELQFEFINPSPADLARMPSQSTVGYLNLPRYITGSFAAVSAGASATLQSSNITLGSIPDLLIIAARRSAVTQSPLLPDSYLSIRGITLQWNNRIVMSSTTTEQLFNISKTNGLYQSSWLDWYGKTNKTTAAQVSGDPTALTGSILVLRMARDIALDVGESPSKYGNYQLSFQLNVVNEQASSFTPELIVIPVFSGLCVSEAGNTQLYEGVLSTADILAAQEKEPISTNEYERMLGSGLLSKLKSGAMYLHKNVLPHARKLLEAVPHQYAQKAANVMKELGYGKKKDLRLM